MPKTIWNEGRVMSASTYELYARYVISEGGTPSDIKSWLASSLSFGASLLLWVSPDSTDGVHYRDFAFPTSCRLGAANTIYASFFSGEGSADANGWATKVTSYGALIENDITDSPPAGEVTDMSEIPVIDNGSISDTDKSRLQDFAKILDGVVIQPGTWTANSGSPAKSFAPKLTVKPTLRLSFEDKIENGFWLLLTGFTDRNITLGLSSTETSIATTHPEDGDFLGPAVYPWAAKVVFCIPPVVMSLIQAKVDIDTVDIAALQIYNTRYIWSYCNHAGSSAPTQDDLKDAKSLYQLRGVTGYVSDAFINTYCVDIETVKDACASGHISDGLQLQLSYINQLRDIYGNGPNVDTEIGQDYKFFFWTFEAAINGPGQQGMFYPVNIHTKSFAFTLTKDTIVMQTTHGFNFTSDTTTMGTTSTDIMGTLYPVTSDYSVQTGGYKDADDNYVFTDHPILHYAVKDFQTFTRAMVAVPKSPIGYNNQFVEWFASLPLAEAVGMGNVDPATTGASILTAMGVDDSYKDLDFQSFLQYAAAQRDLTQPLSEPASTTPIIDTFYMYSKDTITSIADSEFTWDNNTVIKEASAKMVASTTSADYYKPSNMSIITVDIDSEVNTSTTPYTVRINSITDVADVTTSCTSTSYHRWASTVANKESEIKALSLIDNFGSYLPTAGVAGNISVDVIKWADLLDALNINKSIDILGGLINLKNSGDNYIQLSTGLRLYISATEPTGTIPENSIGIGWGSSIYKYTSGSWSAIT